MPPQVRTPSSFFFLCNFQLVSNDTLHQVVQGPRLRLPSYKLNLFQIWTKVVSILFFHDLSIASEILAPPFGVWKRTQFYNFHHLCGSSRILPKFKICTLYPGVSERSAYHAKLSVDSSFTVLPAQGG